MPNDAKVGMIVGLGLVIIIAVVFFHKRAVTATTSTDKPSAAAVHPAATVSPTVTRGSSGTVNGKTATRLGPASGKVQSHTVREGETLFTLAHKYYNDGRKFVDIFLINRDVLKEPDPLVPGTVLLIPDVPEPTAVHNEGTPN
jgi:nucleoid-associated protein YgaU